MNTLEEAYNALALAYNISLLSSLRDNYGIYGYIVQRRGGGEHVLCAKASMKGYLVSCHKKLAEEARARKIAIIMGIKDGAKFRFYRFLAMDILTKSEPNVYHGETMLNFDIRLGKNIESLVQPQLTQEQLKHLEYLRQHPVTKAIQKEFGAVEVQRHTGE